MIVLYNVVLTALAAVLEGFATLTHFKVDEVLAFLPGVPTILIALNADAQSLTDFAFWYLIGNSIVLGVVTIALFSGTRDYFREWNAVFRSADALKSPAEASESAQVTL